MDYGVEAIKRQTNAVVVGQSVGVGLATACRLYDRSVCDINSAAAAALCGLWCYTSVTCICLCHSTHGHMWRERETMAPCSTLDSWSRSRSMQRLCSVHRSPVSVSLRTTPTLRDVRKNSPCSPVTAPQIASRTIRASILPRCCSHFPYSFESSMRAACSLLCSPILSDHFPMPYLPSPNLLFIPSPFFLPLPFPFSLLIVLVHVYVVSDVDHVERFRLTLRFFDDVSTASWFTFSIPTSNFSMTRRNF